MPTFICVDRHTEVNESCHLQRTQAAPERAKGDVSANISAREVEILQHKYRHIYIYQAEYLASDL